MLVLKSDRGGMTAGTPGLVESKTDTAADRAAPGMKELYDRYAKPLLRFLLRLTAGDRHLAEDLMQETMLRAWRNLNSLPTDPEHCRMWLFTVARRVAIDAARARHARPAEMLVADLTWRARDDVIEGIVAVHTIRSALPKLSPDHRAVLVELYYWDNSVAETAVRLGIPEGTVKSRAHYALCSMRAAVRPGERA
jgi:RNA polymerase sigma-70 factor, ECF subfamily